MVLAIVGILLGALLLLLVLFVALPVFLYAYYERGEEVSMGNVSVHPFAGLLGLRFSAGTVESKTELMLLGKSVHTLRFPRKPAKRLKKEKEKPKPKVTKKVAESLLERIALFKRLFSISIRPALSFLKFLSKAFKVRFFHYDIAFGLGDPASTGQLFGFFQALIGSLGTEKVRGELRPDFQKEMMQGKFNIGVTVKLYRIMAAIIVLAAPILWRLGVDYLKGKWQRQEAVISSISTH